MEIFGVYGLAVLMLCFAFEKREEKYSSHLSPVQIWDLFKFAYILSEDRINVLCFKPQLNRLGR